MEGEEATVSSRRPANDEGDNPSDPSDDLTRINGIGRAIARRLQASGIRTYMDLAGLLPEEIAELLSDVTGVSAGRVAKEDWSGQARELAARPPRDDEQPARNGQHYESFVMRMLLDEDNDVHSTTIEHVQSGEVKRWAAWEPAKLASFIEAHTMLPAQAAPGPPALEAGVRATKAKAVTESVAAPGPVPLGAEALALRPERHMVRTGEPLTVSLTIDLRQVSMPAQAAVEYTAVVLARPLQGGPRQSIGRKHGTLTPARSATIALTSVGLPKGVYRLEGVVSIREAREARPAGLAAVKEDEILQVYDG